MLANTAEDNQNDHKRASDGDLRTYLDGPA
jgi:hypothetical protein